MIKLSLTFSSLLCAVALVGGCKSSTAKKATTTVATPAAAPAASDDSAGAPTDATVVSDASISTDVPGAPAAGPIYFEFDSAVLTMASRDSLAAFAPWAVEHKAKLRIEGHTDERGTTEYNLGLGDARAQAVASYLMKLGVGTDQLATVTYGEERPAVDGTDESAYAQNRRGVITQ